MAVTQGAFTRELLPGLRDLFKLEADTEYTYRYRHPTDGFVTAEESDPDLLNWWDEVDQDYLHSE